MNDASSARVPLLELSAVCRHFPTGEAPLTVLDNIDLKVFPGEMIALVGPSGSGKSTLMNILGCLDRPDSGQYRVAGQNVAQLSVDRLAQLRREHFGFVFQRYHLLPGLDAAGNVELPAIYAGVPAPIRARRAKVLLARLGLAERVNHRPAQLSGGQQQRVSIARALINGAQVILADEPTGALDSQSGEQVMGILKELHREGHTVIVITHDRQVASHAQRIVELRDGCLVTPCPLSQLPGALGAIVSARPLLCGASLRPTWRANVASLFEAARMALRAMNAHRLRSFLTMLGIIVGIASVVSVVALGEGSRRQVVNDISFLGTHTITVYPGSDWGGEEATPESLVASDADALAQQPYADSATPGVRTAATLRYRSLSLSTSVQGVGEQHFRVHGIRLAAGRTFSADSIRQRRQEGIIDHATREKLFARHEDPIGQIVMLGSTPLRIIGVAMPDRSPYGASSLTVWVPYTTAQARIVGGSSLQSIVVRIRDDAQSAAAERDIVKLLSQRHGQQDFFVRNSDSIRGAIESATARLTLLIAMIALISLVVGGIGVMNIMLVSVTERIREIGVRMAVGARPADIMGQFLIEAILICLLGAVLGIVLALGLGALLTRLTRDIQMHYSLVSIVVAVGCSTLIGLLFGFLPARNAAALQPVEALARE